MARNWTPIVTFVLGITLTIGVYESLRLVRNTSKALTLASNQMTSDPAAAPPLEGRRQAARKMGDERRAAAANPEGRPLLAAQPRTIASRGGPGQTGVKPKAVRAGGVNQRASLAEKRQILMDRLENMTEEEKEAWRAKREARKQRQRDRVAAFRARREAEGGGDIPAGDEPPDEPPAEIADTADPDLP